ncbi:hypothetical protein Wildcat_4 [Mycobacterium phage Wildcat]|uniref:Uncharacterized protein n=3 Tax=Mycobacterium virus Wildcat TaxID=1993859 RepID=Q19Y56_9CAUD|nr:hypothetical protein Wildcat_4 [Mycobacterium phage Wildcat]ABE67609.1 hypothetical protein Wildcat_4 [Mycobacterium phage Wildcat]AJD82076.1 hypothetical protein COSMO_4 [Mycobacterium phage Cosmo]QGJ89896.1 hypothetical protein PBI_MARYV_4 [Mycobacterium phage MaryV]WKR36017.1 hypothetical protein [Mycobacterium phage Azrael100]
MSREKIMRCFMEIVWFATKTLALFVVLLLAIALIGTLA